MAIQQLLDELDDLAANGLAPTAEQIEDLRQIKKRFNPIKTGLRRGIRAGLISEEDLETWELLESDINKILKEYS